jgi:hypothetical protein
MMTLDVTDTAVDIRDGGNLAGRYHHADDFKPHLHPLNTPKGHTLSLVSPHDHKHHKGLMYALKAADVNFWEELPGPFDGLIGRQRHDAFVDVVDRGESVGFTETLTWLALDGSLPTFRERRTLACSAAPDRTAYSWTWTTTLEALRDCRLVMSGWSAHRDDGALVNYHGLGLRFRRDFGCTRGNDLRLDGAPTPFAAGMGATPRQATFRGSIDGTWPVARAGVSITQDQQHALFVLETPFAFMSLGPSNLSAIDVRKGETLREHYTITVFDDTP